MALLFWFVGEIWDLIVLISDRCVFIYFLPDEIYIICTSSVSKPYCILWFSLQIQSGMLPS